MFKGLSYIYFPASQGLNPHMLSVLSWSLLAVSQADNGKAVLVFNVNYHGLDEHVFWLPE